MSKKIKNLTGKTFGRLTAIRFSYIGKDGSAYWECYCDCGDVTFVSSNSLSRGLTKSCGCLQKENVTRNIEGERFGHLVAVERNGSSPNRRALWKCVCDCGGEKTVESHSLINGNVKTCGCRMR